MQQRKDVQSLAGLYWTVSEFYLNESSKRVGYLEKAVAVAPKDNRAFYQNELALVYLNRQHYLRSFDMYKALHAGGQDGALINYPAYALAAFKLGYYREAIDIYEKVYADAEELEASLAQFSNLIDRSYYVNGVKLQARLNQFLVAQAWGRQREVNRFQRTFDFLADELGPQSLVDLRDELELEVLNADGWRSANAELALGWLRTRLLK